MIKRFRLSMNSFRGLLLALLLASPLSAGPRYVIDEIPDIWGSGARAPIIESGLTVREMTGDETWPVSGDRVQLLHTGTATRTIVLPAVGSEGCEDGTVLKARVTTAPGAKILFRKHSGELIAFWGNNSAEETQWATFEAHNSGWKTQTSRPAFTSPLDGTFSVLGASLVPTPTGAVQPDSPRTIGYALRFESESRDLYIAAQGRSIRFRVLADDSVVAQVAIARNDDAQILVPIHMGKDIRTRKLEIVADELTFAGIETPDANLGVRAWKNAIPLVRTLWITDETVDASTSSYPWAAARLLKHDLWCRSWSTDAGPDHSDEPAISLTENVWRDIASINPDVIVVNSMILAPGLEGKDYAREAAESLDAIRAAARPDSVKLVVWTNTSADRQVDKLAGILRKQARRHDFEFVDWRDWIEGTVDNPASGNAHLVVSEDQTHPTDLGNRFLGYCFAGEFRRLGIESAAQTASILRNQAAKARNLAAAEDTR